MCVETHIRRLVIYDLFINALTRFDKFRWRIHIENNWINIFYVVQFLEHSREIYFVESYFLYHRDCQWRLSYLMARENIWTFTIEELYNMYMMDIRVASGFGNSRIRF